MKLGPDAVREDELGGWNIRLQTEGKFPEPRGPPGFSLPPAVFAPGPDVRPDGRSTLYRKVANASGGRQDKLLPSLQS